jgi:homoserine kinase type II
MSVFTTVTSEQLSVWLKNYSIGGLRDLQGILAGIENTNYFITTTQGRFVLTLFEKLKPGELLFYLDLMAHLSSHGIPCPKPIVDLKGNLLGELNGKPATIVTCLQGKPSLNPTPAQCARVGEILADMHLAGQSYQGYLENLRGPKWWSTVAPEIYPFLTPDDEKLLRDEIAFQARHRDGELPRGVVHADLFRDNVLFSDDRVGGFIDFYFACIDALIYDVAITVNDWCMKDDCTLDLTRSRSLLQAYQATRPFTPGERGIWQVMLRAGALRFWVSRLYDYYIPRPGVLTHAHDPERFRCILLKHIHAGSALEQLVA